MKAAVVEKPGRLVVRDIPEPEVGNYDTLCRILYGATCTATDRHIIAGEFLEPVTYPTVLGHESIGEVISVGPKVRNFRKGYLVTRVGTPGCPADGLTATWGGFAELGIARDHWAMRRDGCPREEWDLARRNQILASDLDPAASTLIINWRETFSYITRVGVGEGARVLIIGSGATALGLVSHARNLKARTVALVGSAARESVARSAGASAFFDYCSRDPVADVKDHCGDEFDFILDAVGKSGLLDNMLPLLRAGGTVGIYGCEDFGRCSINPTRAKGTFTFYQGGYDEEEAHQAVVSFMRLGALDPSVLLDLEHPFALSAINEAFEALRQKRMVKALIRIA